MDEYAVVFARSARKELERLGDPLLSRILKRIETLALDPRPDGCRKLQGASDLWRIRVGDYRSSMPWMGFSKTTHAVDRPPGVRLVRRMQRITRLPAVDQKAILHTIDSFLEGAESHNDR